MLKPKLLPLLLVPLLVYCSKNEAPPPSPPAPQTSAPTAPAQPPAPTASEPATSSATPPPPAAGNDAGTAKGEGVYKATCSACHAAGVAGAPKLDDKADWQPRIAQGNALLYEHAIKGFTGKKGVMPPKGGNTSISDEDVKAAVDYMVAQAK